MPDSDFPTSQQIASSEIDQDSPWTETLTNKYKNRDITAYELALKAKLFGGSGRDGAVTVSANTDWDALLSSLSITDGKIEATTFKVDSGITLDVGSFKLSGTTTSGSATITMTDTTGVAVNQQLEGTNIPVARVISIVTNTSITISHPATASGADQLKFYKTTNAYIYASTSITIDGTIDASGAGGAGAQKPTGGGAAGINGSAGLTGGSAGGGGDGASGNGGGNGGDGLRVTGGSGGGGGGIGVAGSNVDKWDVPLLPDLTFHELRGTLFYIYKGGGGGGSGVNSASSDNGGVGGNGGGQIYLESPKIDGVGTLKSNGLDGGVCGTGGGGDGGSGGGGGGGCIYGRTKDMSLFSATLTTSGGTGGAGGGSVRAGGNGGDGVSGFTELKS